MEVSGELGLSYLQQSGRWDHLKDVVIIVVVYHDCQITAGAFPEDVELSHFSGISQHS